MLSKRWLKFIKSLQIKKYRKEYKSFFVEGEKSIVELLRSDWKVQTLFATPSFLSEHADLLHDISECEEVSADELTTLGMFSSNTAAIAVVAMKEEKPLHLNGNEYALALDDVNDPGNLGTIIRVADWYGIKKIICSNQTADLYNPKVIAASKGSFLRVDLYYCDLHSYLQQEAKNIPVIGTYMGGNNIHAFDFPTQGILLMGNEARGISDQLTANCVTHRVTIPSWGDTESLNVGVATAICCDNLRRVRGVQ